VFYQNAYPVTAVVYGLYPLRDPNSTNLAPLRDGDLNCVAQRVVEHFEGALKAQGLTPTRRQTIQEWEDQVHEFGSTVDDVAELEKVLKRAIILRDIAGEDIYNSGRFRASRWRPVDNGHAWSKDLHFSPKHRGPHLRGRCMEAIREATQNGPKAVWLLGGQDRQLTVDQFVLQDGRTYMTRKLTRGFSRSLRTWVIPRLPIKLSERTTPQASWPKKETTGSRLQPAFSMISKRLAWSTATAVFETRWTTTPA